MIPKIIHHIWTGSAPLPTQFLHHVRSWRESHPDWEHLLWTDRRLPLLRLGHVFDCVRSERIRQEIVRAEVLAQFGGIVPDHGAACVERFDVVAESCEAFVIPGPDNRVVVGASKFHGLVCKMMQEQLRHGANLCQAESPTFWEYHSSIYHDAQIRREGLASSIEWKDVCSPVEEGKYEPESIVIAVRTIRREVPYIHQTLASLFAADPWVRRTGEVLVIVGNEHWMFLKDYFHHEAIRVVPMTDAELLRHSKLERTQSRASLTQTRCYNIPLGTKKGIIMLEDDVICRDHFLQRMLATIREMEEEHGIKDYALSMYSPYDFESTNGTIFSKRFCNYNAHPFACTQGMYFPAHIVPLLSDAMERLSIENYEMAGDILVGEQLPGKIYATPRTLIQHTGDVSTGQGGTSMDQTLFHRPYVVMDANGDNNVTMPYYPTACAMNLVAKT